MSAGTWWLYVYVAGVVARSLEEWDNLAFVSPSGWNVMDGFCDLESVGTAGLASALYQDDHDTDCDKCRYAERVYREAKARALCGEGYRYRPDCNCPVCRWESLQRTPYAAPRDRGSFEVIDGACLRVMRDIPWGFAAPARSDIAAEETGGALGNRCVCASCSPSLREVQGTFQGNPIPTDEDGMGETRVESRAWEGRYAISMSRFEVETEHGVYLATAWLCVDLETGETDYREEGKPLSMLAESRRAGITPLTPREVARELAYAASSMAPSFGWAKEVPPSGADDEDVPF